MPVTQGWLTPVRSVPLCLQHNLTGTIPPSLAALPDLLRFAASDNSLTGGLPARPAFRACPLG